MVKMLLTPLENFYKNKRILLTGHTGFKGSWMSMVLEFLGAKVCGYALPVEEHSFFRAAKVQVTEHHEGDITDREHLNHVITSFQPEIVIHLASHSSLDGSYEIPSYILTTNIMGVVNLLDIIKSHPCIKSVLVVTSDKCYQNMESDIPYQEDCTLDGIDPYSVSKVCQELVSKCYQKTFFENTNIETTNPCIATARASNVIGFGDYHVSRLVPYLQDCFSNGHCAVLRKPDSIRPWQYVLDVVWGYLLLSEQLYQRNGIDTQYNGPYNFGPYETGFWKVRQIVETFAGYFPDAQYQFDTNQIYVKETNILKLNSEKAQKMLNWHPLYNVEDILKEIAKYTILEKQGEHTDILVRDIIRHYMEKVNSGPMRLY